MIRRSVVKAVSPFLQVCLVGQDGTAVLRRLDPIFDPTAIEREVASICAQVWPLCAGTSLLVPCFAATVYRYGCCVAAVLLPLT